LLVSTKLGYRKIAQKGEGIAFPFFVRRLFPTVQMLRQIWIFGADSPCRWLGMP